MSNRSLLTKTMLWKLILSLTALFSLSGGSPLILGPLIHQIHEEILIDEPQREFTPYQYGPQTPEEEALAQKALHGVRVGGDMVWPDKFNQSGDGVRNENLRWPNGVIPFVIDDSLNKDRELILKAMQHYHDKTCIRFIPRTNQNDYVRLFAGQGCWAIIGRNRGKQELSLGSGCVWFGLIVHELGHTIGLIHEHQRSDRDNYIWVYHQNVVQGQSSNFYTVNAQNELRYTEYDYDSIMHYGNYAFSKDESRLLTMEAKNGHRLVEPYNKAGFTNNDIIQIKKLYKCP